MMRLGVAARVTALLAVGWAGCQTGPAVVNITLPVTGTNNPDMAATVVSTGDPGITVSPKTGLKTTASGMSAQFTIVLDAAPTANVTIALSSSDTTQGTVSPAKVVFTPDNWDSPQKVTVTGADDHVVNGDHAYTIITAPAVSDDDNYTRLNAADVSVTNIETDVPSFVVMPTAGLVTKFSVMTASFTVQLETQPTATVSIGLASSDTSQGTVSTGTLTFTTANWKTPQTVTVTGVDDQIAAGDIPYSVNFGTSTSTDTNYNGLSAPPVSLLNKDVDTVGINVAPTSTMTNKTGTVVGSFTIVLNSKPIGSDTVTIPLHSSDTSKGNVSVPSVTFSPANWNTAQTVTTTGVQDNKATGNESYTIVTGAATSADTHYAGIDPSDVTVTLIDTNVPGITVSRTSLSAYEGHNDSFSVALSTSPASNVTISLSAGAGSLSTTLLTFTPGSYGPQTVTWYPGQNTIVEGNRTASLNFGAASSSDSNYNTRTLSALGLTILDDDIKVWVGNSGNDMSFCSTAGNVGTCVSAGGVFTVPILGGTVNFIWQEGEHNVHSCRVAGDCSGLIDSSPPSWVNEGDISNSATWLESAGQTSLATPTVSGYHAFYCQIHGYPNMWGYMRAP